MDFLTSFKAARRAAVPMIALRTSDPTATVNKIIDALPENNMPNMVCWDLARGAQWLNPGGMAVCVEVLLGRRSFPETEEEQRDVADELTLATGSLPELLHNARKFPANTILFVHNYQLFSEKPDVLQATINLRDLFKANKRILAPVTTFGFTPHTIVRDAMVVLDDPLPDRYALGDVLNTYLNDERINLVLKDQEERDTIIDAVAGLATFSAEQAIAMSLERPNPDAPAYVDINNLWDRKRKIVRQAPGLSIYEGKETFADLGGLQTVKGFMQQVIKGRRPPKAILFTDEIEKQMGGSDSDLSGIQQMQLGKMLTWSQEKAADGHMKVSGVICLGHPGAGKSAIAKALGNEAGVPCIVADLGDTKNSLVGASEERMSSMLQVVDAIGQGSILWIATCNGVEKLKPEFLSRFALGQFFFDLPDAEEREAIWQVYIKKYGLDPKQPRPNDEGWVGREVEACCYKAWMLNLSLVESGKYVVVGSIANSSRVQQLRTSASGNYLSASYEGYYRIGRESRSKPAFTEPGKGRSISR